MTTLLKYILHLTISSLVLGLLLLFSNCFPGFHPCDGLPHIAVKVTLSKLRLGHDIPLPIILMTSCLIQNKRQNFSSFIPEIVESLFNVPSFSPCHPFISVLLSQPFWNADSIVMCLCQKPFHEAFWERLNLLGQHIRLFGIWALLIPMASCSASMRNSSFQLIEWLGVSQAC